MFIVEKINVFFFFLLFYNPGLLLLEKLQIIHIIVTNFTTDLRETYLFNLNR